MYIQPSSVSPPFPTTRAVDNQVYVATASPARDETASYVAWGHSTVVSPWSVMINASVVVSHV